MNSTETQSREAIPSPDDAESWVLVVVSHPEPDLIGVRRNVYEGDRGLLGRTAQSFFPGVFDEPKVSREHARITHDGVQLRVTDLDSRNGTYVNDARLVERELEEGDVVGIGNSLLLVTRGPESFLEPDHPHLWGNSPALSQLLERIEQHAAGDETVLLVGESGTGKELVARALHQRSQRPGSYVPLNCGGLPEGVLHTELFGHVRGAFSGAEGDRKGLVQMAEGGTLFLDEVASAPTGLQTSLLRLLDDHQYRVVGTSQLLDADIRIIAAMHPDGETVKGPSGLRQDLYFRLTRRVIRLPALRERREDIPLLARRFAEETTGAAVDLSPALTLALLRRAWPGNVRELRSVVERVAIEQKGDDVLVPPPWLDVEPAPTDAPTDEPTPKRRRRRLSRDRLVAKLRDHEGSVTGVAAELSVDRKTIYRWVAAHRIDLERVRDQA